MRTTALMAAAILVLTGWEGNMAFGQAQGKFVVVPVKNPEYRANQIFLAYEDFYSPRMAELRSKYGIDAAVAGKTDEWERILALEHWIKEKVAGGHATPPGRDAFAILDAAQTGSRFDCGPVSTVEHAVMNSHGYVTRRLGAGPGLKTNGGHHGVTEVWVNKFGKWVVMDAEYELHFEKDGVPLSALEIRDEIWKDGGKSVVRCFGPERRPTADEYREIYGPTTETYRWVSWEASTNHFTAYPAPTTSTMVMFEDNFFRNNVWYRDGKPHWAYNTPYLIKCPNRSWIEWTPNVISAKVQVNDQKAVVTLTSFTPNFRSFQMKTDDGTWADCGEQVALPLARQTNAFTFRTVNLFGVTGPEHRVQIDWQKA